ncbi:hypothetical protein ACFSWE_13935 [Leucobacter albus]|uniref:Dolichyl-phosphate-mannose-protein mannosyltransferase n=1 Tax=Leucobacter albus TaxID=272210 RepID=A0ABW3TQ21_9MICO
MTDASQQSARSFATPEAQASASETAPATAPATVPPAPAAQTAEPGAPPTKRTGMVLGTTAGIATLFLLLRLLAVSEWNWNTAGAIADSLDFGDALPIAFGTLFARPELTGFLVALLLPFALVRALWPLSGHGTPSLSGVLAAIALVTVAVVWVRTFNSWWVVIGAAVLAALLAAARLIWRRGVGRTVVIGVLRSAGVLAVVGLLGLAVVVDTPWMSKERLATADGPLDGWVLEVQPGFVKLLTEERDVHVLLTGDIVERELVEE